MKYYVMSPVFGNDGAFRMIETTIPIDEAIKTNKDVVPLKDGNYIGIELLRNSYIMPVADETSGMKGTLIT